MYSVICRPLDHTWVSPGPSYGPRTFMRICLRKQKFYETFMPIHVKCLLSFENLVTLSLKRRNFKINPPYWTYRIQISLKKLVPSISVMTTRHYSLLSPQCSWCGMCLLSDTFRLIVALWWRITIKTVFTPLFSPKEIPYMINIKSPPC